MEKVPKEFEKLKNKVQKEMAPIKPATKTTKPIKNILKVVRLATHEKLPNHYLIYFLLVDFLGFKNYGRFEKIAWSIPIDFHGQGYVIEYRKFGVGIFGDETKESKIHAEQIVCLINRGVKVAQIYYDWIADKAVKESKLNVHNNNYDLFFRYDFFRQQYESLVNKISELEQETRHNSSTPHGINFSIYNEKIETERKAKWMAMATIDAFFSWTEHIFILIGILFGRLKTGEDISRLATSNWRDKFRAAFDLSDEKSKNFYDSFTSIREQVRNYIAHGAFGKKGEAFQFHSSVGAVPVFLPHHSNKDVYRINGSLDFDESKTLHIISDFIEYLWSGKRKMAKLYIVDAGLPLMLTLAQDSTYENALNSLEEMERLIEYLSHEYDVAANMDW
ncbi:hypothetical protein K1X76_08670 [bacterium]|nr:hypothetical protein [bacterium]